MSNVNFLESNWKDLARLGKLAEKNILLIAIHAYRKREI